MEANNIIVTEHTYESERLYKDQLVLKYTIKYPQFSTDEFFQPFIIRLNYLYSTKVSLYQMTEINKLYQLAVQDFENSQANNYPFQPYELYITYEITLNANCTLSLYFDNYQYTGGAHGITTRKSYNWDLVRGKSIELYELISHTIMFRNYIITSINNQIKADIESGNNIYFENYEELVRQYFNPSNFYLTEEGVVIYYQLYEIAPYVSGIRTFLIPYTEGEVIMPSCE